MSESNANPRGLAKCTHKTCLCLVQPGESYCSEHCEHADHKQANTPEKASACECGHSECK